MFIVKPAQGARVRHPDSKKVLNDEGCRISSISPYWTRRIADGSVTISELKDAAPTETKKKKGSDEQ